MKAEVFKQDYITGGKNRNWPHDDYMLVADYVPDQPANKLTAQWLLSNGPASGGKYLVEQLPG